ncbi:hypothetical protein [Glaciimonas sp. PCH181]|uniref:hypothetical protein n=1 Tax=Glaciimonas sp. PCH181 TaxID=2133943 RepID=UPI000D367BF1|nr:hypothetical protein [Glaciimonas sp. PCH181]PUA19609.1 hypothetical protein C7W93_07125 [Glaciimonas sp. PCH181]
MKKGFAILFLLAVLGCSKEESSDKFVPEKEISSKEPEKPVTPTHYYSIEEDGEYGYERAISENDQKNGVRTNAVMMARYLGEKDGVFSVQLGAGQSRNVHSCKTPCDFVKSKQYYGGQLINTETLRNAEGSVIWAIMQDAQRGQLVRYSASRHNNQ